MPIGHWFDLIPLLIIFAPPILVGFLWIRPDADTRGQPGLLWALLTIPLTWVAVLVYLVMRSLTPPTPVR
jgi:hypothetical protein